MARIGTRAEVWFSNVVASFARYVAERTLPESVPMLMRRERIRFWIDSTVSDFRSKRQSEDFPPADLSWSLASTKLE